MLRPLKELRKTDLYTLFESQVGVRGEAVVGVEAAQPVFAIDHGPTRFDPDQSSVSPPRYFSSLIAMFRNCTRLGATFHFLASASQEPWCCSAIGPSFGTPGSCAS